MVLKEIKEIKVILEILVLLELLDKDLLYMQLSKLPTIYQP